MSDDRAALVEVERSRASQQYLAYRETVINAAEEVGNGLVSYLRERRRRAALQKSVAVYKQAAALSGQLYETGAGTFLDVLDAQRSLYAAEDALVQSEVAIAKAYIALCKALGGGWAGVAKTG